MSYETLGLTLLHFTWQGAGLAALAALMLHVLRRRTPETRYAVLVGALVMMAACPPITYGVLDARPLRTSASAGSPAESPLPAFEGAAPARGAPGETVDGVPATAVGASRATGEAADLGRIGTAEVQGTWRTALSPALPWIVGVWLIGVLLLSLRLLGGWLHLRRLGTRDTTPPPVWLAERSGELIRRLGIARPVRLVLSARVAIPSVSGWLKPVVLFPVAALTCLTPVQLEAILAHELAHIRRHDTLVNAVQTVVETLLFYHPAVWWLSRQIREERERCCDDVAVELCGDAHVYARALLGLETLRGPRSALAVAADGGSLLGRVRRLFHPDQAEVEMFPRWTAGFAAMTVALFLVVGSDLAGSVTLVDDGPAVELAADPEGDPRRDGERRAPDGGGSAGDRGDTGRSEGGDDVAIRERPGVADDGVGGGTRARDGTGTRDRASGERDRRSEATPPDTVLVHPGGGTLAGRVEWAREAARSNGFGTWWIAWAVRPTPSLGGYIYSDRSRRMTTSSLSFRGTITGNLSGFNPGGLELESVVGPRAPDDVVILLRVGSNGRLSAARLSSFAFRIDTAGEPLVWLGGAPASESVPYLVDRYASADEVWLKEDLATAVGVHDTPDVVVPVLVRWLESDEPADVRDQAVDWLGHQPDPRSLDALVRATTRDPSREVRTEAAEALGELDLPEALDALLEVVRANEERAVRVEAVEALGERRVERALDALVEIAREDRDRRVREEAVESIGEHDSERKVEALEAIIRDGTDARVVEEALETFTEVAPRERTLRILREQVTAMADRRIAGEAVEQIGELGGPQALEALEEVIRTHRDERIREEAVETYAEVAGEWRVVGDDDVRAEAARLLVEIAGSDESPRVREEALDALIEMPGDAGIEALIELARSGSTREIRITAIEALADSDDPRAAEALDALLRREPPR